MSNELMKSDNLAMSLMEAKSEEEIKNIISMFNMNIRKKNVIRSSYLSDLQDRIVEEMGDRVVNHSSEFSNKDLLEYLTNLQNIVNKVDTQADNIPKIAIQKNTTINVNNVGMTKESRARMKAALDSILKDIPAEEQSNIKDVEGITEN